MTDNLLVEQLNYRAAELLWFWDNPKYAVATVTGDEESDKRWWQFWKLDDTQRKTLSASVTFLLNSLEDLIKIASKYVDVVVQKEEVIDTITNMYDTIIYLPLFLKPFGSIVRNLVVGTLIPALIDYIASKTTKV